MPNSSKHWTPEEIDILRKHAGSLDNKGLTALLPGRTQIAIQNKRAGLKLPRVENRFGRIVRLWSEKDDFDLRWMAGRYTSQQIAEKLGRTTRAVCIRAHLLDIPLREGWTLTAVARLFRMTMDAVGRTRNKLGQNWRTTGKRDRRGKRCKPGEDANAESAHPEEIQAIAQYILSNPNTKCETPRRVLQLIAEGKFEEAAAYGKKAA